MSSFPSAAMQFSERLPQQQSPLAMYAQLQQIRNAQQQQQLVSTEVQQRQLALQDQQATTAAMREWDGKNADDLPPLVLKHGGSSTAVFGLKNTILDWKTKAATLTKDQLDNLDKTNTIVAGHLESVKSAKPEDKAGVYSSAIQDLQEKGLAKPGQFPDQYPGDDVIDMYEKQHMGQKAIVEQAQKDKEIQQKKEQLDLETKKFLATQPGGAEENPEQRYIRLKAKQDQGGTLSPEESSLLKATTAYKTLVPQFNLNIAANTGAGKPAADVAKQFGMTPEAFDQAAEKYYQTGAMPQMGRNAQGMALQRAIMNRTGELHAGESLGASSAGFKANQQSLEKLQSNLDQVSAFEKTAVKNLDMFTNLAQKAIDTGIPLLNKPLRGASQLLGSQDQAAFEAARQVAVNEIAKVTSSPGLTGQLSDTARREVASFIPDSATVGQIMHLATTLKQDMANRHTSYDEQIKDIKGRLGGNESSGGGNKPLSFADWKKQQKP